jgi:hypothetical protein
VTAPARRFQNLAPKPARGSQTSSVDRPLGSVGRGALTVALLVGVALAMPDPVSVLNFLAYAAVGAFVAIRRPHNPIGWLLVAIAFGFIATSAMPDDTEAVKSGTSSTPDFLAAWVGTWAGSVGFLAYATLAMIFPSGHLPAGRWRRAALGSLILGLGVVFVGAIVPKIPFSPDGGVTNFMVPNRFALIPPIDVDFPMPGEILIVIPIGVFAIGVLSAVTRYRRATGVERLQLRWLMAAIAFAFAGIVAGLVGWATIGLQSGLIWLPALIAYPTVPLAVGIAVMRYRLLDIDRIISRTIAYGAITAVLFAVFGVVNLAMQTALRSVVTGNTVSVAVSTLAVAALFNPLRKLLQGAVDRRFNRSQQDHERLIIEFAERLREEVDLASLSDDITDVVETTLHPTRVHVWIRRPGPTTP